MKRLGGVYDAICDYGNLLDAFGKVQRGKRSRPDIESFRDHLDGKLLELSAQLQAGDCDFGHYRSFKVFDPKERTIHAALVRERVIHHAVVNRCGAWLEAGLIDDSYACRRGKGQHAALRRAQEFARRHEWCLKLDIRSYFDSIDHALMLAKLNRRVKDARLMALFDALLESYSTAPGKGLPIGNLTSQYFANLYLDAFDRWAGERANRSYLRYMDDMLVFGTQEDLRELKRSAADWAREHLLLTVKHGGDLLRVSRGVDFLGFQLRDGQLRLNRRSKRRFLFKLKELRTALAAGTIDEARYQQRATALFAFVAQGDTYHFRLRHALRED